MYMSFKFSELCAKLELTDESVMKMTVSSSSKLLCRRFFHSHHT